MEELKSEFRSYFSSRSLRHYPKGYVHPLTEEFARFQTEHPDDGAHFRLKAFLYRRIAEYLTPHLFAHSPFYFATDIVPSDWENNDACPAFFMLQLPAPRGTEEEEHLKAAYAKLFGHGLGFADLVDRWHFSPNYTKLLRVGFKGVYDEIQEELARAQDDTERDFLKTAEAGVLAIKSVAEKFASAARKALETPDATEEERRNWQLVAETAPRVPWLPPRTFYEGLETLLFVREIGNIFDGIHLDIVGHPDRQLWPLYQRDLQEGRLTRDEAYRLVRMFLLVNHFKQPGDENFEEAVFSWREEEKGVQRKPMDVVNEINATLVLGGCDSDGARVCNDLTMMFLQAHREDNLIFPKLLCRYDSQAPQAYLDAINRDFLGARSVMALVNDEAIIPAQVSAGKKVEDARLYQVGGCWEITLEGMEDSSGVTTYFNLGKLMELSVTPPDDAREDFLPLEDGGDFEDVFARFMANLRHVMEIRCRAIGAAGPYEIRKNPCPLFSAMLSDCVRNRRDYSYGGGRYNPHANPFFAFANAVDSLMAIKRLCFTEGIPLKGLMAAVRNDWKDEEELRQRAIRAPHWGDNCPETNEIARRLYEEICRSGDGIPNERGGGWQTAFYVYRPLINMSRKTGATPDGRHDGDWLAQGITPSRIHKDLAITDTVNAFATLDARLAPGSRVLDLNIPLNAATPESLDALERIAARQCVGMLQLNCVSREQLLDAQAHPERYPDLIVRLYGYSARFVTLPKLYQDEFIARTINK